MTLNRASVAAATSLVVDLFLIAVGTWLVREVAEAIDEAFADALEDDALDFMLVSCNGREPEPWEP